uniref:Coiled-coil and C2 domain-containing protein 2A n=1 Tax=Cacopsylla melanoneura TaxID=428564 RepID=A0A8D8YV16_9HEMI
MPFHFQSNQPTSPISPTNTNPLSPSQQETNVDSNRPNPDSTSRVEDDRSSLGSSRPSSSHDSAMTVLTAVAQVHVNRGFDLSSEEDKEVELKRIKEAKGDKSGGVRTHKRSGGTFNASRDGGSSDPTASETISQSQQPVRPQLINQEEDVVTELKTNGGGTGVSGGQTRIGGVEVEKDTDSVADMRKPSLSNAPIFDSRRPSVADTSEGSRSQTPHSDTRSYRERLKDRIQTVKEKASSSVFTTQSRSRLRQKLMKQHSTISQMNDMLRKEEAQVSAALEKHNQIKSKWKTVTRASLEIAQSDEAFDFFTKVWDDETTGQEQQQQSQPPTEPPKSTSETSSPKGSDPAVAPPAEITSEPEDKAKLGAADYLGLRTDDTEWSLTTKWMPAIDKVLTEASTLIYYPSTDPVPLNERLDESKELRCEENEGIFVPAKPYVRQKNYNKLQQRLLSENNRKWFGESGEVICEPDPLLGNSYRPSLLETAPSPGLELVFVPALKFDALNSSSHQSQSVAKQTLSDEKYFLQVKLLELNFSHHPLFSREHVLTNLLSQVYDKYVDRIRNHISHRLGQRLTALRSAKHALSQIQDGLANSQEDKDRSTANIDAINKYKAQIRDVRSLKFREQKLDRELLAQVLIIWRELKTLRQTQKYNTTGVKLKITQEIVEERGNQEYETELNETWNEVLEEALDSYEEKKKQYDEWLMRHENNDDLTLLEENRPPLPELIDQSTLHESVVHQVSQCVRPSNEPRVSVELVNTSVTPESDINDASELIRRVALSKVSVWVKVLYNGVELCRSASQPLSGTDFTVPFNQLFTVRILNPPETLSVEVYTDGPGQCHPVAEIFVPIPNSTSTLDNSPPEYLEFSSDQVWNLTGSTAVGSGSAFHLYPNQDCSTIGQLAGYRLFTSGRLSCTAGWMCKDGVVYSVPAEMLNRRKNVPFRPLSDVSSDVTKLKQWCDQSQLDPNDPNNAPFFTLLKNSYPSGRDGSITSSTFRLNPALALFEFCSLKQLDTNPRLMLLQLRDRGEPEFRGMRPIPLKEREIPADIFKIYEKRLQSPVSLPLELSSTSPQNPLELVRSWGSHHLNNIRDRVLKQCKLAQQHRTVHDVISEDHVPDVGTLGLTFVKWLQPDRPLRPKRKERKKIPVQSLSGQEVKVIVSVVRAFEIPTRKDVDALATPGDDKINMVPVRPFVEVSFGNYSARTTTASGASPTWNQDLVIPLLPATSDFSPGALQSINSCLHVHLFDEVVVDLIQDEAERETNVHQRLERNWLGSLSIPFSTLYFNSKIEGTLKLYSPPFLLGYDRSFPSSEEAPSHLHQSTYLTLFIMVQPPLNTPEPLTENLECSEAPYVEKYLRQYAAEYRVRFPHRDVKTLVIDVTDTFALSPHPRSVKTSLLLKPWLPDLCP